jgi:hypothetical protein
VTAPQIIQEVEAAGGVLKLDGDRIRYDLPRKASALVEILRQHRNEVLQVLRERERNRLPDPFAVAVEEAKTSIPPNMPAGVRLLDWQPKAPPVELTSWSVVVDVALFVQTTLWQLDAALRGDHCGAGNLSARTLCERLEQAGVKVELVTK